ncbi:MAG: zinc ribbon domain-containing protein [Caldimonas sp.]
MSLTNYRDVGGSDGQAGFQFEFSCGDCSRTWKSPYRPYRKGQLADWIYKLAYFIGDRGSVSRATNTLAAAGSKGARDSALQEAIQLAEQHYVECPECRKAVCEECWDTRARLCIQCVGRSGQASGDEGGGGHAGASGGGGMKCSNCGSGMEGGRFCPECGFDVASTHKSCPGCGTLCTRTARFCTDCGHGF